MQAWLDRHGLRNISGFLGVGAASGVALGLLGAGYVVILHHIPALQPFFAENTRAFHDMPNAWIGTGIIAVFLAPFAEEYLFRGLLFRALDREWGGWRAIVGSAVFFAIYHPPISWLPVGCLGLLNAWLFKSTGRLAPCVLCHMAYNAIVVGLGHS
jgi:membrane protease YdiL (CAAX protease family)